ncbi:MAG TPA: GGDEF domain-containing protein [Thermomonas sp.]|nr:GGDEF domain-containing protein [Thermomonas sp.]
MDALTAALALVIAQVSIALVMTGAHVAARRERSTRYWATAAILIVVGVLAMVAGAGHRPLLQLVGTSCLVFGAITQFWGLQIFYRQAKGRLGWLLGVGFSIAMGLMLAAHAPRFPRIVLLSATLLVVLALTFRVLLAGMQSRRTFGSVLTLGGIGLLMVNNVARIASVIRHDPEVLPMNQSVMGIAVLYLVPLGGIFLYATGLLLLYFERLVDEKHQLATHDELTGLLNRRAIVAAGEREVALAIRNRQPLTVAYVDIDFFKRINDELGHEAGDAVLADLANLLRRTCRAVDLVGRHGGEEFCLVLPGVGPDGAACLGGRLLAAVRAYRFRDRYPVTMSIGFASLADAAGDQAWAALVNRADTALYRAKQAGRDRFCIAPDAAESSRSNSAPA